jgi:hypothetical protein
MSGVPAVRETVVGRVRRGDDSMWIVRDRRRDWQTDANVAIAGFLFFLYGASKRAGAGLSAHLRQSVVLLEKILSTEPMRHVLPGLNWANTQFPATLTAKSKLYRNMWRYIREFRRARRSRIPVVLRGVLLGGWLRSENDDRLLELFGFSKVIEALHSLDRWRSFRFDGVSKGAELRVVCESATIRAEVLLDQSVRRVAAHYDYLISQYAAFHGKRLRPDIQIYVTFSSTELALLVDAKATTPDSQYGRDSLVKVLGYLKNYEDMWDRTKAYPRAIILFPDLVDATKPLSVRVEEDEVIVSDPPHFRDDFLAVVEQMRLNT